ncbi:MAG: nitroreductase family protein [Candidatus Bathyarchaeota archaeon]|nr:nitroreductase family protein [Candidatus Bathyarchaeota archaeon]
MNPVIEVINKRRSIRAYEPKPVPKDIINTIIEAGNQAPSQGREVNDSFKFQPWRFVVVEDAVFRQQLVETTMPFWKQMIDSMKETHPQLYKNITTLYDALPEPKDLVYHYAPVIIFVIGPPSYAVSCALACENIMLAATSLGLGTCYVGFGMMVKSNAEVVQALELTEGERIYGPILLGYPRNDPKVRFMDQHHTYVEPTIKWI